MPVEEEVAPLEEEEVAVPLEEKKLHRWILGDDILMVVTVVVPTVLMRSRHPCWRTNAGL